MPNYPAGRTFDGYRGKVRIRDDVDGVRVIRTWAFPSKSSKFLPRFMSYASFTLSSLLLGIWGLGRQDIVLFDTPPLPLVPTGLAIGRIARARTVMNVSDIWPEMATQLGYPMGKTSLWALKQLESLGYRRADIVTTTNRQPRGSESDGDFLKSAQRLSAMARTSACLIRQKGVREPASRLV